MSITHTINSQPVPAPITFEAVFNPVQRSAMRNGNGSLIREVLPDKWSLKYEWKFKTPEELYAWANVLKALTQINFTVVFPSPWGNSQTITAYISPISHKMLNYATGNTGNWREMSCEIVEV